MDACDDSYFPEDQRAAFEKIQTAAGGDGNRGEGHDRDRSRNAERERERGKDRRDRGDGGEREYRGGEGREKDEQGREENGREKQQVKGSKKGQRTKSRKCYLCEEFGHIQKDCPQLEAYNQPYYAQETYYHPGHFHSSNHHHSYYPSSDHHHPYYHPSNHHHSYHSQASSSSRYGGNSQYPAYSSHSEWRGYSRHYDDESESGYGRGEDGGGPSGSRGNDFSRRDSRAITTPAPPSKSPEQAELERRRLELELKTSEVQLETRKLEKKKVMEDLEYQRELRRQPQTSTARYGDRDRSFQPEMDDSQSLSGDRSPLYSNPYSSAPRSSYGGKRAREDSQEYESPGPFQQRSNSHRDSRDSNPLSRSTSHRNSREASISDHQLRRNPPGSQPLRRQPSTSSLGQDDGSSCESNYSDDRSSRRRSHSQYSTASTNTTFNPSRSASPVKQDAPSKYGSCPGGTKKIRKRTWNRKKEAEGSEGVGNAGGVKGMESEKERKGESFKKQGGNGGNLLSRIKK